MFRQKSPTTPKFSFLKSHKRQSWCEGRGAKKWIHQRPKRTNTVGSLICSLGAVVEWPGMRRNANFFVFTPALIFGRLGLLANSGVCLRWPSGLDSLFHFPTIVLCAIMLWGKKRMPRKGKWIVQGLVGGTASWCYAIWPFGKCTSSLYVYLFGSQFFVVNHRPHWIVLLGGV